ncbi:unnamed protein product, partial [Thelazia callipaeda]|uniref:Acyl_transf_3 domain-containing protein n=1 Tax=Thelazia callipaeda TaxID=103827 RepID=A0A0N5CPD0_THECL
VSANLNSSVGPDSALHTLYGEGKSNEIATDSRFQYRMLHCFKLAGETDFTPSNFPTLYCYRYNPAKYGSLAQTICIPASCSEDEGKLWDIYEKVLQMQPVNDDNMLSTCIRSRNLRQWYQKPVPLLILLYLLTSWIIVGLSTHYHIRHGTKPKALKEQIFLAFSIKQNIQMLFQKPKNHAKVITCMFGIRFLTIVWIIVGHTFAFVSPQIKNIIQYRHDMTSNFLNQWLTNFVLSVDIFFVLGGTVNAYGFFLNYRKLEKKPSWTSVMFWLNFYFHRILRLWPAYFYTLIGVIFFASLHYRSTWPMYDPLTQCPKYWWQNLLFIASLSNHHCMGYVSTEFIFYLLSPIFLLTFVQNTNHGYLLSIVCISLSDAARAYNMIANNMPPTQLGWSEPHIYNSNFMEHFSATYIKPQFRIAPYIIGLCLGHCLAQIQLKKLGDINLSKGFLVSAWILAILIAFISTYGLYPILMNSNCKIYYLLYGALHRTAFAVSIAWIIYACHNGYGGLINRFLSWEIFLPLSVLCYSVYLSHFPVVFATYLRMPFPYIYKSKRCFLLNILLNLIFSYILGLQASILSEFPALNIERCIRNYHLKKKQEKASSNDKCDSGMKIMQSNS